MTQIVKESKYTFGADPVLVAMLRGDDRRVSTGRTSTNLNGAPVNRDDGRATAIAPAPAASITYRQK